MKGKFDVIFFMNGHDHFKKNLNQIMKKIKTRGLIVDGRYYFTTKQIIKIKRRYNFLGVGW